MAGEVAARAMTEKQLQQAVMDLARLLGWRVFHTFISVRSAPGFPDIVGIRASDGRLFACELKSARGKLTPAQEAWLADFRATGAETYVFRPEDWHSGRIEEILR